ncbi:Protein of unknown function [Mycobacterium canettii CIPT 140070008]|nr:Protein of unknown function [Mycobacterium canettii CIPT 140070008]
MEANTAATRHCGPNLARLTTVRQS